MARPRLPIGQHGEICYQQNPSGTWTAICRMRYMDGTFHKVKATDKSRIKAQIKLKEKCERLGRQQTGAITADMTLSRLADLYMRDKASSRTQGTIDTYNSAIKHIRQRLGQLTIGEATPMALQTFLNTVMESSGYGAASSCRSVLSGMMGVAVRNGALSHNPVSEVERLRRPDKSKPGSDAIPLNELREFLQAVESNKRFKENDETDPIRFMILTGLRDGECFALCWDMVNLKTGEITVSRTVKREKGVGLYLQNNPKSEHSNRTIRIPESAAVMLKRRYRAMPHGNDDLVFPAPFGAIREVSLFGRHLRRERATLGLDGLRITGHSLRKTCASILHMQGLSDLDVADYLGQSNVDVTQQIYIARNQKSAEAARMLDDWAATV